MSIWKVGSTVWNASNGMEGTKAIRADIKTAYGKTTRRKGNTYRHQVWRLHPFLDIRVCMADGLHQITADVLSISGYRRAFWAEIKAVHHRITQKNNP